MSYEISIYVLWNVNIISLDEIYQSCQRHSWLLQAKVVAPPIQPMNQPKGRTKLTNDEPSVMKQHFEKVNQKSKMMSQQQLRMMSHHWVMMQPAMRTSW